MGMNDKIKGLTEFWLYDLANDIRVNPKPNLNYSVLFVKVLIPISYLRYHVPVNIKLYDA